MEKKQTSLKVARIIYAAITVLLAITAALFETDFIPQAFINASNELAYALNLACIVLTMGFSWGCLRLFAVSKVKEQIAQNVAKLSSWNIFRTTLLGLVAFIDLVIYYGMMNGTTPLFCLLIALASYVFCWPKQDEV